MYINLCTSLIMKYFLWTSVFYFGRTFLKLARSGHTQGEIERESVHVRGERVRVRVGESEAETIIFLQLFAKNRFRAQFCPEMALNLGLRF